MADEVFRHRTETDKDQVTISTVVHHDQDEAGGTEDFEITIAHVRANHGFGFMAQVWGRSSRGRTFVESSRVFYGTDRDAWDLALGKGRSTARKLQSELDASMAEQARRVADFKAVTVGWDDDPLGRV